jgi:epoxyqueuosine reductase
VETNKLRAEEIVEKALAYGFEKCGIIRLSDLDGYEQAVEERSRKFPYRDRRKRTLEEIEDLYPWAQSVVVCVWQYGKYDIPPNLEGYVGKYYQVDGRRNEESEQFRATRKFQHWLKQQGLRVHEDLEHGVTPYRWAAAKAGLGIVRKNNFFYTESGSWVLIVTWLIDQPLELVQQPTLKPCPETCDLCIRACPTKALAEPFVTNKDGCISHLTKDYDWERIDTELLAKTGNWVFGCDVCQDVCPHNKNKWQAGQPFPGLDRLSAHFSIKKIVTADYKTLQKEIQAMLWHIGEDELWKFKMNALNIMLHNYKPEYAPYIDLAMDDKYKQVREMAKFVRSKTSGE